jgi:ubiquitin-activating enzyme E1
VKILKSLFIEIINNFLIGRKIFCDFGEKFEIIDQDGKERGSSSILSISKEGIVNTLEPHDFQSYDWVKFKNIEGMIELNGKEFEIIKKCKSKKTIY